MYQNPTIPNEQRAICLKLLSLFTIDGERADKQITEGQLSIFHSIVFRPKDRVQILTATQYGKSLIVAIACVVVSCIQGEVVSVVAPSNEKAKIIMRYFIEHLGDSVMFYSQLEQNTKLDRLRQEESKERIIMKNGGGIFVVSANVGNSRKTIESAMGLGSKIVIQDESCLIPDDTESTIFRMIAGKKDAFYCKIGNPFYRTKPYTHFWESWNDPAYYKVFIDYKQGLQEGRYQQKFIEEAIKKPNFMVLYECMFPNEDLEDQHGYTPLLTTDEIELAMADTKNIPMFGEKMLGADVAASGLNESVIVVRGQNIAEIRFGSSKIDPLEFAGRVILTIKDDKLKTANCWVDDIGVGATFPSLLREQGQPIMGFTGGEQAIDQRNFINKRAEAFWKLRHWVRSGGKLRADERWYQLSDVRYKADSRTGRLKIMSKDEMRRYGIPSPDVADALMMTFAMPVRTFQPSYEEKEFALRMKRKKEGKKVSLNI